MLLDLDGTLLDTLDDIAAALGRGLHRHGYDVPSRDEVARMVGDGAMTLVARALERSGAAPEEIARVHATFLEEYAAEPARRSTPKRGCLELLDALARAGTPAVVVTNKRGPLARRIVELTLAGRVRATIGGGDVPRLKPAPDLVLAGLEAAGVPASTAWMVGDSEQDVLSARAAGVVAVGVRGGYGDPQKLDAAGADLVVDDLAALVPLVTQSA